MAWATVQSNMSAYPSSPPSQIDCAFDVANTANNCILVLLYWDGAADFDSLVDSQGNTYTRIYPDWRDLSTWEGTFRIYFATGIDAGANTVSFTTTGSPSWGAVIIAEFSGIDSVEDVTNEYDGSSENFITNMDIQSDGAMFAGVTLFDHTTIEGSAWSEVEHDADVAFGLYVRNCLSPGRYYFAGGGGVNSLANVVLISFKASGATTHKHPPDGRDDLNKFTKTDPGGKMSLKENRVEIYDLPSNVASSLAYDYGADHFGDFVIDFEFNMRSGQKDAVTDLLILSSTANPDHTTVPAIVVQLRFTDDETGMVRLFRDNNADDDYIIMGMGRTWYLRLIRRLGDGFITLENYEHESRSPSYFRGSAEITNTSDLYRYLTIAATGWDGPEHWHGRIRNFRRHHLDIEDGRYYLRQTSFRFRKDDGDEDGASWKASENMPIVSPLETPVRLRTMIQSIPVAEVDEGFDETAVYRWEEEGDVDLSTGRLVCTVGAGADAVNKGLPLIGEAYLEFDYSWDDGWAQGGSTFIVLGQLRNVSEISVGTEARVSFAINTATGKVGIVYLDNSGVQTSWTATSEGNHGTDSFSRVRLYFKIATSGANGIIKLWYNDALLINLTNVANIDKYFINSVVVGNCYSDGSISGTLNIHRARVWRPYSVSGQLQLEFKKPADSEWQVAE
jgi:hypothetical protein